jgi:hypothetical protein
MKSIDAIEGAVKCILNKLHEVSVADRLDDSEYIRSVKAVLDATDTYLRRNQQTLAPAGALKSVLYDYSKDLWRSAHEDTQTAKHLSRTPPMVVENDGYRDYYYDYIYNHGVYPR